MKLQDGDGWESNLSVFLVSAVRIPLASHGAEGQDLQASQQCLQVANSSEATGLAKSSPGAVKMRWKNGHETWR